MLDQAERDHQISICRKSLVYPSASPPQIISDADHSSETTDIYPQEVLKMSPQSREQQQELFWQNYAACPRDSQEFSIMAREYELLFPSPVQTGHLDSSDSSDLNDSTKE